MIYCGYNTDTAITIHFFLWKREQNTQVLKQPKHNIQCKTGMGQTLMDDQTNLSYVTQHVLLIPQSRESLFNFLRFNLRPSLSKAAARAELVFTDPDFPQPVFQLPDIIQPEFIFFPRSSVWMDPPAFRVTNSISCKPLQSPPEMDSLPSPTHAFSAFCQCAHFHTSIPSPHSPFSHSHSAQLCMCFSAQGITCQHLVHILN